MKKKILALCLAAALVCMLLALSSCSVINKILGRGEEEITPPTITSIEVIKDTPDYKESKEYLFNKDKGKPMAVASGTKVLLSITYDNPAGYAISSVTVNNERRTPEQFAEGSDKYNTLIPVDIPEDSNAETELNYTVNKVFYNAGSRTIQLPIPSEMTNRFTIKVNPRFTIKLNYQNRDRRSTSAQPNDTESPETPVLFGADMSSVGVTTADYSDPTGRPEKAGGWAFEGWYTEPNGGGILVTATDKYYFWDEITLYAYYTRLFEYEIVNFENEEDYIVHEYTGREMDGTEQKVVSGTKTFRSGVIITKDNTRGSYPNLSIDDTIVDEKWETDARGNVTVTPTEYPVVAIKNEAFKDKNNILTLHIGKYVKEIGYSAFDNCSNLVTLTFSPGCVLEYIGDYAFQNTKSMTDPMTLPDPVKYIGNFAFRYSAWHLTANDSVSQNSSTLRIRSTFKFLGAGCFFQTGFTGVVFDPGCHFSGQIDFDWAKEIENGYGWKEFHKDLVADDKNLIGSRLFEGSKYINSVQFLTDEGENNAINIIPDRCFDVGQYPVAPENQISIFDISTAEGLEYIGMQAFNYQSRISYLHFPASVKEIGREAFSNNTSVIELTFAEGSLLEVLHTQCFWNIGLIDRVTINSTHFSRYGNGPFNGCNRLKIIEFPNINTTELEETPHGFYMDENPDEVYNFHYYSDLLYGTFTSEGQSTDETGAVSSGYALPVRVLCPQAAVENMRKWLTKGKEEYVMVNGKPQSTGTTTYNSRIFVNDMNNKVTIKNEADDTNVEIIAEPIYTADVNGLPQGKFANAYSLVYWSERSKSIRLPANFQGSVGNAPITELAMYALPTSVEQLEIPESYTRLEHDALNGCINLTTVTFTGANNLEYIGDYAFFGTKITGFEAGPNLKVIGQNAFMRCRSLRWVDLRSAKITNPVSELGDNYGRQTHPRQYKYEYELQDSKGNYGNVLDHVDVLYDGAFQGCVALAFAYLPQNLKQVPNALFDGCSALLTVVIPSRNINPSTSQTDYTAFYYRSMPTSIFDRSARALMTLYAPRNDVATHRAIFGNAARDGQFKEIEGNETTIEGILTALK